ncbi:DUF3427 domain-containing protein [Cytobacillus firmus]|nr:DUF3427 domain-containing protein [Cytobacillus firmus]
MNKEELFIKPLILGQQYSRKEVHNIFDPFSNFTPRRGIWGLHGIVKIPDRINDFVFFVTLGHKEGEFEFKEGVTEDGILTWQSQPKQKLSDSKVQDFINHNHLISNIYLFLRTRKINPNTKQSEPYYFLGRLAYLSHDPFKEQPVHFKWQIIDWDLQKVLNKTSLADFIIKNKPFNNNDSIITNSLTLTHSPKKKENQGRQSQNFNGKVFDFAEEGAKKLKLGLSGEKLVFEIERKNLNQQGRSDLAEKVIHISQVEGDGAGYDILSWTAEGKKKYIEVKTTRGGINTPYYMSRNELFFSKIYADNYYLYRLYEFNADTNHANFYIKEGDITSSCSLVPTQFKVF